MKILCFIYSLGPGGAERVLSILTSRWAQKGYDVAIVTYDQGASSFFPISNKVNIIKTRLSGGSLPRRFVNHLKRPFIFRQIIKNLSPDIIISFMDKTNLLVLVASSYLKIPVIISERIDPRSPSPGVIVSFLRRFIYKKAAALIALSKEQANWFKNLCEQVIFIPNPIEISKDKPYATVDREHTIIAVGRLTKQKGFDLLLQAFCKIHSDFPEWKLVIYGQGPEKERLEDLACKLKINEKVTFAGLTKELPMIFLKAGIFVLPSRWEGFPNVLIEAMAAGCPVIATDCTDSILDIVSHEESGILVPTEDIDALAMALKSLLSNASLRNSLGKKALKSVEQFSLEKISKEWETLFLTVTGMKHENFKGM